MPNEAGLNLVSLKLARGKKVGPSQRFLGDLSDSAVTVSLFHRIGKNLSEGRILLTLTIFG
jgi:hypothetical protein